VPGYYGVGVAGVNPLWEGDREGRVSPDAAAGGGPAVGDAVETAKLNDREAAADDAEVEGEERADVESADGGAYGAVREDAPVAGEVGVDGDALGEPLVDPRWRPGLKEGLKRPSVKQRQ
jgi:hypothetical protein